MRPLVITADEKQAIADAIARARAKPITMADIVRLQIPDKDTVTLADRRPEHDRPPSHHVAIPFGYHLAISFEEQPAGMCMHLSMSVERAHKLPNPHAIGMMIDECLKSAGAGTIETTPPDKTWIEEFKIDDKPGGLAFNALFVLTPGQGGTA